MLRSLAYFTHAALLFAGVGRESCGAGPAAAKGGCSWAEATSGGRGAAEGTAAAAAARRTAAQTRDRAAGSG